MTIPPELIAVLPEAAGATDHVQLRSGLDTLLGETHLAVVEGRLLVASRSSLLTPLERLPDVRGARLEAGNFREVLRIEHAKGSATVTLGFGDADAVKELLGTLGETESFGDPHAETEEEPLASVPGMDSMGEPPSDAAPEAPVSVDARDDDGEVIVSAASVREVTPESAAWEARVATAIEHERAGRLNEALKALEAAAQARAPAEVVVPAMVRVARAIGDTRRLSTALRRSKKLTKDKAARRAIDHEIRALVTDLVYDGPEAAGPAPAKKGKKPSSRSAEIAAPHHVADPNAGAEEKNEDEDEDGEPSEAAEPEAPKAHVGKAWKPPVKPPEQAKPDVLLWALLILLVTVGAGAALLRLLG